MEPEPQEVNGTFNLEFEIVDDSSKRGRPKLVDNRGYSYNIQRRRGENTDWQCTVRPKVNPCKATVIQRADGTLTLGRNEHNHPGQEGALLAAKITARAKKDALDDLFKPAMVIVNQVLMEEMTDAPCPSLPKPLNLAKAANYLRQRLRPSDPTDLNFEIDSNHIPEGFMRGDIKIGSRRHLIFATDAQLSVLSGAKNWYVDGTFKLCKAPFTQLLTVNAFVRREDHAKQVPLVFALMSGKKKKDYRAVIREIIKNIPGQPSVKKVTVDFERAIWSAFQKVLPEVRIMGCAFHWSQALWRKVQELGLQQGYRNDRGTHDLVRKLLALPFLPADEIPNAFHRLEAKATTEPLQALAQYINNTWISSTTWHPSCWSVFQQSVRTNNDTEGWHHGLNRRAQGKSQLPFYLLVELLFQEAKLTSLQIRLVSDKKLKRIQRKEYRNVQARLFEAWDKYQNGDISVERLLKTASHLVASQI